MGRSPLEGSGRRPREQSSPPARLSQPGTFPGGKRTPLFPRGSRSPRMRMFWERSRHLPRITGMSLAITSGCSRSDTTILPDDLRSGSLLNRDLRRGLGHGCEYSQSRSCRSSASPRSSRLSATSRQTRRKNCTGFSRTASATTTAGAPTLSADPTATASAEASYWSARSDLARKRSLFCGPTRDTLFLATTPSPIARRTGKRTPISYTSTSD